MKETDAGYGAKKNSPQKEAVFNYCTELPSRSVNRYSR